MTVSFERAETLFQRAVENAQAQSFPCRPVHSPQGAETILTPKAELAALKAAAELMKEAACTPEQKKQAKDAQRRAEREFRPPYMNVLAALVDGININSRKRRMKKHMIQYGS